MKKVYTEKIHAGQLLRLLESNNPCDHCVASYNLHVTIAGMWINSYDVCEICKQFLGYTENNKPHSRIPSGCPCHQLGEKEAFKRSWIQLENKGYLDG